MEEPSFVICELKSGAGQLLSVLTVSQKDFKTGSRGFYANQKLEMGGKRYQVQIQMVEIGSKKAAGEAQDG